LKAQLLYELLAISNMCSSHLSSLRDGMPYSLRNHLRGDKVLESSHKLCSNYFWCHFLHSTIPSSYLI